MTLNGVMDVTLRYFIEFGKPVFQHVTASICGGIHARNESIVFCSACTMSSLRKFTFAISSPAEFLVCSDHAPLTCSDQRRVLIILIHASGCDQYRVIQYGSVIKACHQFVRHGKYREKIPRYSVLP